MSLRVGIVGCGMIAGAPLNGQAPIAGNHAGACQEAVGLDLVAACDPDESRRIAFGDYWRLAHVTPDVASMFEAAGGLDLVIVAAPAAQHEAACATAVRYGARGILCEKPMSGTAASAQRIVDGARAADCALVVNFMRRWDSSHQNLARRIAAGQLGELRIIGASYTGTLRGNGTHFVDTLQMLAPGSWNVEWASPLALGSTDGAVDVVLRHEHGARASLAAVRDADYFVYESHMLGTRGRARLSFGGNDIRLDAPAPRAEYPGYLYLAETEQLPPLTLSGAFTRALQALADRVAHQRPLAFEAQTHVATLALIDSIVERSLQQETPR